MAFVITKPLDDHKAEAVVSINNAAGEKILARYPQHKQANMTARAIELQSLNLSGSGSEWMAIKAAWDWVKSVRDASNVATEAVTSSVDVVAIRASESAFRVVLESL